jgi:hypothetical protein
MLRLSSGGRFFCLKEIKQGKRSFTARCAGGAEVAEADTVIVGTEFAIWIVAVRKNWPRRRPISATADERSGGANQPAVRWAAESVKVATALAVRIGLLLTNANSGFPYLRRKSYTLVYAHPCEGSVI